MLQVGGSYDVHVCDLSEFDVVLPVNPTATVLLHSQSGSSDSATDFMPNELYVCKWGASLL
jgi:hypothetical protein